MDTGHPCGGGRGDADLQAILLRVEGRGRASRDGKSVQTRGLRYV